MYEKKSLNSRLKSIRRKEIAANWATSSYCGIV